MKCPNCKSNTLENNNIMETPITYHCSSCHGSWMRYGDYQDWHKSEHLEEDCDGKDKENLPVLDSKQAKLCPDCERILIKYRVHYKLDFYLEHCGTCNGIWFDKNEWEVLKKNCLHGQLHSFFTRSWQNALRDDITREHFGRQYLKKFGQEDYKKLKDVKEWLDKSKTKSDILAYLMDDDPYRI